MGFTRPDQGPPPEALLQGAQFQGNLLPGQWSFTFLSPVSVKAFPWKMPKLSICRGPGKPVGLTAALAKACEKCPFRTLSDQSPRHFWGVMGVV